MRHDLADVLSDKMNINIHRITITSDEGIFYGNIEVRVHDRDEVRAIMDNLKVIDDLKEVQQII